METIREQIRASNQFILYERVGREIGTYVRAKDCANAAVIHPHPERLMVRGLASGRQTFRMPAEDFGMAIFD